MASYAKDPRCTAMAEALVPLLRRNCPEGAGGFGGSYQVNLDDEEAVGLGGVELIRAAMRKGARQLGWKVTTIGWIGTSPGEPLWREASQNDFPQLSAIAGDFSKRNRCGPIASSGDPRGQGRSRVPTDRRRGGQAAEVGPGGRWTVMIRWQVSVPVPR
ncbi:hypothetical protein ACFVW9_36360 [Streptomyces sp. NPDC058217]|uniref:hypothetical protein n=1 Tax=Streptomyces sp. NPDC058217 TaxID=3346384 RepID=UPI0036ECBDF5